METQAPGARIQAPSPQEHRVKNQAPKARARLDRYIGYYEPYVTRHDALDKNGAMQEERRNVARAAAKAVVELRSGRLQAVQPDLSRLRPK